MRAGTLNRATFLLRKKGTPTGVATVIYDALRESPSSTRAGTS
jgi:hypothetical protein